MQTARNCSRSPFDPWVIQMAEVVVAVCACLAIASALSATAKFFRGLRSKLVRSWVRLKAKRQIEEDIPHMTPKEIEIISWHVWDVLIRHKAWFPSATPEAADAKSDPWAVHWMAR